jgi:DNA-binding beta-propeller fold protein YncE
MSTARHSSPSPAIIAAIGLLIVTGLGGCATKPGIIFDPANTATRWPPAPDEARVEYIGEIRTDADLKPGRGMGGAIRDFFAGKREPVGMVSPLGLCTDDAHRLYVADPGLQGVHVFDLETRDHSVWRPGKGAQPFVSPVAVAFDRHGTTGRVLVVDSSYAAIFAFDLKGNLLGILGKDQFTRPVGMAVEPGSGRLIVADAGAHQILVLNPDGSLERRIGERGSGLGQFNFPTNVAIDSAGNVHVSDSLNFRVQVLGADLSPRRQIGSKGDLPGYFAQPKGIAFDPSDHLYVVDAHFEAIQLFDLSGTLLMSFGREGRGPGEFWLPAGIHADGQGMIWVADSYNRRVQVFRFIQQGATP